MRLANLMLLTLLLCMSCGNDDELQKEGNCLTAKINGEDFTAETTVGTFNIINIEYGTSATQETRMLNIIGTVPSVTGDTKTITLNFACSEFTSELNIVETDSDCGIFLNYQNSSFTDPNAAFVVMAEDNGIVNIEEVSDEKIKGTFSFSGEDQDGNVYNITNGFFDTTIE